MTEQEFNNLKVGDRVRYIHEDDPKDIASGYFPPIGTLGTVLTTEADINRDYLIEVKWDEGTKDDGEWWCARSDVEIVNSEERK